MDIPENVKEEINRKKEENWIDTWFAIETLAVDKEIVENALKRHIEKLAKAPGVFVYASKYSETEKVENPLKNVKEAFSQVAEVKLFIKNVPTLINIVLMYGPSSVEILGPNNKDIKINEMQDVANLLAGLVHQFASAGVGGVVISSK
jgi:hypothetical protein